MGDEKRNQPRSGARLQPTAQSVGTKTKTEPAAKRRRNAAHGASRGQETENANQAPKGRKNSAHGQAVGAKTKMESAAKRRRNAAHGANRRREEPKPGPGRVAQPSSPSILQPGAKKLGCPILAALLRQGWAGLSMSSTSSLNETPIKNISRIAGSTRRAELFLRSCPQDCTDVTAPAICTSSPAVVFSAARYWTIPREERSFLKSLRKFARNINS